MSVTSVCLKEIVNGQSFAPLMIGSKRLRSLKIIGYLGDWDDTLEKIGNLHTALVDVHLEKIQVSDVGLVGLSKCLGLDTLHIVKIAECSNVGLNLVAKNCRMLRKLHVDGWRTNRIGDDGLDFCCQTLH
nr:F-box protein SKIP2-like [Arachis hypogaea]